VKPSSRNARLAGLLLFVVAAHTVGCTSTKETDPVKEFTLSGEVVRLNTAERIATIRHEKIEGWMEAMTMDFPVREGESLVNLQPGKHIKAKVYVRGLTFEIGEVSPASL
jgi:Cu/Ag efflux protein CusF